MLKKALEILRPGSSFEINGEELYENIIWKDLDNNLPSREEVNKTIMLLHRRSAYSFCRERDYPKEKELLIALWELVIEQRTASADQVQLIRESIKQRYPKP